MFFGGRWVMEHVAQFSAVWWLAFLVCLAAAAAAIIMTFFVLLACGALYLIYIFFEYVYRHPW